MTEELVRLNHRWRVVDDHPVQWILEFHRGYSTKNDIRVPQVALKVVLRLTPRSIALYPGDLRRGRPGGGGLHRNRAR